MMANISTGIFDVLDTGGQTDRKWGRLY